MFYDGSCGLCHRTVRFVLARDRAGHFRFAALESAAFRAATTSEQRATLPDSLIVRAPDGELRSRSDAVVHILVHLRGLWRLLGKCLAYVPARLRDWAYDRLAASRRRWFAPPETACPVLPAEVRDRFLD